MVRIAYFSSLGKTNVLNFSNIRSFTPQSIKPSVFLWLHFHKDQELETEFRSAKIWVFMKVFLRRLCKRVTTSNSLTETLLISFFYSIFKHKYLVWVNQNICILSLKTLHWSIESVGGFHYCFLLLLTSITKATVVPNTTQIFFL